MYRWNVASLTPMALAIASSGSGFGAAKVGGAENTQAGRYWLVSTVEACVTAGVGSQQLALLRTRTDLRFLSIF